MKPEELEARRSGFVAGFAIACAILASSHMEGDLAIILLDEAGITLEDMRRAGVDRDDIETLQRAVDSN